MPEEMEILLEKTLSSSERRTRETLNKQTRRAAAVRLLTGQDKDLPPGGHGVCRGQASGPAIPAPLTSVPGLTGECRRRRPVRSPPLPSPPHSTPARRPLTGGGRGWRGALNCSQVVGAAVAHTSDYTGGGRGASEPNSEDGVSSC